jgi:DNA polymerase-1
MNLARRFYHAIDAKEPLMSPDGVPIGSVTAWVNCVINLTNELRPTQVVAVFEEGSSQFREQLCPEYKAHRRERPQDFNDQLPIVKELLSCMRVSVVTVTDYESDDAIAHLAISIAESDKSSKIFVASADKDFVPLLMVNRITIIRPENGGKWESMNSEAATAKWGVPPTQFSDYLAIVGDASDGYKGISSIGPKTAVKLLTEWKTWDNMMTNIESINPPRTRELLRTGILTFERNRQLGEFMEVPGLTLPEPESGNYARALELLREIGMIKAMTKVIEWWNRDNM